MDTYVHAGHWDVVKVLMRNGGGDLVAKGGKCRDETFLAKCFLNEQVSTNGFGRREGERERGRKGGERGGRGREGEREIEEKDKREIRERDKRSEKWERCMKREESARARVRTRVRA